MQIRKSQDYSLAESFLKDNFSAPTHWPDWNLITAKEFNSDFYYWIAEKGKEVIGVCPVHYTKHNNWLRNIFSGQFSYIPYGGWIFSTTIQDSISRYPSASNEFVNLYSLPLISDFNNGDESVKPFSQKKTLLIDLTTTEEELWMNSVDGKRRNMIRKAHKKGIDIQITNRFEENTMHHFYDIYSEASLRNQLTTLNLDIFKQLMNCSNISLYIITATKEDHPIANVAIMIDKNYAIYWLGNNKSHLKNEGHGELLQWEAIKLAKNLGCKYYDLCYIEPERLPRIYSFKKGFSRSESMINNIVCKPITYKAINKILKSF